MNVSLAKRVMRVYEDFDQTIFGLSQRFGIHCPPGCGHCCSSPKVEATVLEMLPLAVELWRSGQAEELLARYSGQPKPASCLFFTPDELHFNHGRCSVYPHRPTLCRLFGFAAVRDKNGAPRFAACRFIKNMIPQTVAEVQQDLDAGGAVLLFTEAAQRIAELEPALDVRYFINDALFVALEKVGMYQLFAGDEPSDPCHSDVDPDYPPPIKQCS
ncbi:MAG: YkgJ family cysteine cluster protein [Deltaproteobacteria bacterium]|nr:YkgJ family cysteine cluster protein [Deltaproteobacteria bacterium]